ncbi:Seed specific protein Bn15D1B [Rhynchospora pubera]|uniref:Seed specific protein Bn15D1B n=1 Tax=Rhynchospora pubera TaxID=906938 RepID=A0AAV8BV93_9POAL|nr:Seed specific protein Bn15D1B [Rhynchospora pubera]
MAANSKGRAIAGIVGKRFVNLTFSPARAALLSASRRHVHASSYDKNIEDHIRPTVVPNYVINTNSDKYWGPHPKTGVFGPAVSGGTTDQCQSTNSTSSVLDQKVWFRFSEDSI